MGEVGRGEGVGRQRCNWKRETSTDHTGRQGVEGPPWGLLGDGQTGRDWRQGGQGGGWGEGPGGEAEAEVGWREEG